MEFGQIKDAAMLVLMFIVFGTPALAIAARLGLKPVLEAIVRLRDTAPAGSAADAQRLAALEAEVNRLHVEVERLSEAEAFTRQLSQGSNRTI